VPIVFIALFNSILGLSVLFPILAPLGRELGLSELQVGSLSTTYALMQFLVSPVWGRRSESVGRKPVLLIGVLGFGVSFLAFAICAQLGLRHVLGPSAIFAAFLVCRAVGGTFSSATLPTAQAYVADITGRQDRTSGMAVIGAAFGLGIIFGPGIGAALASLSLLAPIYFSAGLAFVNAGFIAVRLREPERRLRQGPAPELRPLALKVWPLLGVGLSVSLASVAMEQTIAFYFQDRLGLTARSTAKAVGIALVCYGILAVLAQGFIVRRFRWSPLRLLASGLPCALSGFIGLMFAHELVGLTAALAVQGLGQGLAMPGVTAAISLGAAENEQGAVAGLNSSAQALGRLLGPVIGTALYQVQPEYPYCFSALLLATVLVVLIMSRKLRERVRSSEIAAET
jgi:MFS family permease